MADEIQENFVIDSYNSTEVDTLSKSIKFPNLRKFIPIIFYLLIVCYSVYFVSFRDSGSGFDIIGIFLTPLVLIVGLVALIALILGIVDLFKPKSEKINEGMVAALANQAIEKKSLRQKELFFTGLGYFFLLVEVICFIGYMNEAYYIYFLMIGLFNTPIMLISFSLAIYNHNNLKLLNKKFPAAN